MVGIEIARSLLPLGGCPHDANILVVHYRTQGGAAHLVIGSGAASGDAPLSAPERTEVLRLRKEVSEQRDLAFLTKRPRTSPRINKVDLYELMDTEYASTETIRAARLLDVSTLGVLQASHP